MSMITRIRAYYRAKRMKAEAGRYFDGMVHSCCRVSANNPDLAFAIHRVGLFGTPEIELIRRPDDVLLHEKGDYVTVKDGYAYELKKEAV